MSGCNDGSGSWGSRFLKVASAAAATAAVAGGLYALLSSSSSELEVPFGAQRQRQEGDDGGPWSRHHETPLQVNNEEATVRWKKPEIGWVKLNVDGSRDHEEPSAGCGGVLRDACGTWLLGFAQKLDPTYEAHLTELQAILTGLELAWKKNIDKLVVECDNMPVVSMVKNGVKPNHDDYDVVQGIRDLCSDPNWEVRLVSISNKANHVADRLANIARKHSSHDLRQYLSPPDDICAQLVTLEG